MQIKAFLFYLLSCVIVLHASDPMIPLEASPANTLEACIKDQGKTFKFKIYPANAFLADVFLDEKLLQSPLVHFNIDSSHDKRFTNYIRNNIYSNSDFIKKIEDAHFRTYTTLHSFAHDTSEQRNSELANLQGYTIAALAMLKLSFCLEEKTARITKEEYPTYSRETIKVITEQNGIPRENHYMVEALYLQDLARKKKLERQAHVKKWWDHVRYLHQSAPFRLREWANESNNILQYMQRAEKIINLQKKHDFPPISHDEFSKIFRKKIQNSFEKKIARPIQTDSDKIVHVEDHIFTISKEQIKERIFNSSEDLSLEKANDLFEPYVEEVGAAIEKYCQPILEEFDKRHNPPQKRLGIDCTIL